MMDKTTGQVADHLAEFRTEIEALANPEKAEHLERQGRLEDARQTLREALLELGQRAKLDTLDHTQLQSDIRRERPEIEPPKTAQEIAVAQEVRTFLRKLPKDNRTAFALTKARAGDEALLQAVVGIPAWLVGGIDPEAIIGAYDEVEHAQKRRELERKLQTAKARLVIVEEAQSVVRKRIAGLDRELVKAGQRVA